MPSDPEAELSTSAHPSSSPEGIDVFDRILVEIDETPESLVAAAQAKCLAKPGSHVEFFAVAETASAAHAGAAATFAADGVAQETAAALEHARRLLEPTAVRFVTGRARASLLAEAGSTGATLVALGLHPHARLTARLFGTLDAAILREASCSVLVARPGWGAPKPRRIVVGVDGSVESTRAASVAQSLASRLDVELETVIALGGKPVDESVFDAAHGDALLDPRDAVAALASAATECDLLVVGHRGATGVRALGSVAERVVYGGRGSVLVVRGEHTSS